jgi:hypothetical protein
MICASCKNIVPAEKKNCLVCGTPVSGGTASAFLLPPGAPYAPQSTSSAFTQPSYLATRNWVLGIIGAIFAASLIAWIVFFSPFSSSAPTAPQNQGDGVVTLDPSTIETGIHQEIQLQRSVDLSVACPTLMKGVQGTQWHCIGEEADGTRHIIDVQLQNTLGEIVWELQP